MKACVWDRIELIEDIRSEFRSRTIPAGTRGTVIERYITPQEGYSVTLSVPNETLTGGYEHENMILSPTQFVVLNGKR